MLTHFYPVMIFANLQNNFKQKSQCFQSLSIMGKIMSSMKFYFQRKEVFKGYNNHQDVLDHRDHILSHSDLGCTQTVLRCTAHHSSVHYRVL